VQTKNSFIEIVTSFFTAWGQITRALEATLIDNLAATIPWLAPVVPAYMIYHSLTAVIRFPLPVAILSAIVVEFLGLVTVSTSVQFWSWNDSKRQTDPDAPVWLAIITAAAYLLVVITVNVILDLDAPAEQLAAKALLSTLSISAALTIAIRSQHARRLAEIEKAKADRRAEKLALRIATMSENVATNVAEPQNVATYARGYTGFVEYLNHLDQAGQRLDKRQAAQAMGRSVRQIERYMEHSASNGSAELLERLS
jgi:hypothetical protein